MKAWTIRRWAVAGATSALLLTGAVGVQSAAGTGRPVPAAATTAIRYGQPNLYTSNVDTMMKFYEKALGFTSLYRFPATGTAAFGTMRLGDSYYVTFASYDAIRQSTGLDNIGKSTMKQSDVTVLTPDVDAAVAKAEDAGAKVLMKPKDQPWGERQAFVADPEGNLVQLSTHHDG